MKLNGNHKAGYLSKFMEFQGNVKMAMSKKRSQKKRNCFQTCFFSPLPGDIGYRQMK